MNCFKISIHLPFATKAFAVTDGSYSFTILRASKNHGALSSKGLQPGFCLLHQLSFPSIFVFGGTIPNHFGRRFKFSNTYANDENVGGLSDICGGNNMKNDIDNCTSEEIIHKCDMLIEVFMVDKQNPSDWRILLAFSKEWNDIRSHFYLRCQERAKTEDDPTKKHALFRLGRKLKEVDEDVRRHDHLLNLIRDDPSEVYRIVSERRIDFTKDFFTHIHNVAESYYNDVAQRDALLKIRHTCIDCIKAFDMISEEMTKTDDVPLLNIQDVAAPPILSPSFSAKMENAGEKNKPDSSVTQMLTKAWSATEETDMTENEAKDTLYDLYKISMGNLQRLMPKELRIMRHLLSINDPEVLQSSLKDAFTPGQEIEGDNVDILYTTPEKLHRWIKNILEAYSNNTENSLIKEARELTDPGMIEKTVGLCSLLENDFL